jgi:hypothetical protein
MEIIIALLVVGFALWWFFIRDEKKPEVSTPHNVETTAEETKPKFIEATVELAPIAVATSVTVEGVGAVEVPAKKTRAPRAPKAETKAPAAKKAAPKKTAVKKPVAKKTVSKKV